MVSVGYEKCEHQTCRNWAEKLYFQHNPLVPARAATGIPPDSDRVCFIPRIYTYNLFENSTIKKMYAVTLLQLNDHKLRIEMSSKEMTMNHILGVTANLLYKVGNPEPDFGNCTPVLTEFIEVTTKLLIDSGHLDPGTFTHIMELITIDESFKSPPGCATICGLVFNNLFDRHSNHFDVINTIKSCSDTLRSDRNIEKFNKSQNLNN